MNPRYEFQGSLYRNPREVADAVIEAWVTAGGLNSPAAVSDILANSMADEIVDEIVSAWGLGESIEYGYDLEGEPLFATWLEARGLSVEALEEAFERMKARVL